MSESLLQVFRRLVESGHTPESAFDLLLLKLQLLHGYRATRPPLPDNWQLTLEDGELMIEDESGAATSADEYVFVPRREGWPRVSKRGRKAYDVWELMFDHLDELVKQRGRRFETFTEAAEAGLEFLRSLAKQRRKEDKGTAIPNKQWIQEKISQQRPDLVIG